MLQALAVSVLLALAATVDDCPVIAAGDDPQELDAAIARAHFLRRTAPEDCQASVDLQLGELLVRARDGRSAILPLTRALVADDASRGRAFVALARAQTLAGEPYDALRSLASAQLVLPPDSTEYASTVDDATLLVRLWVRRGGTSWGSYRFDEGFIDEPKRRAGKVRRLAARGHAVVALGQKGLETVVGDGPAIAIADKAADSAIGPSGRLYLLERSGLLRSDDGATITLPRNLAGDADALAIGPRDEIWVAADGRVHQFDRGGRPVRTLDTPTDAVDLAIDDAGTLHILRRGAGGVLRLGRDGATSAIRGQTGDWRWRKVVALAADRAGGSYVLTDDPAAIYVFAPDGLSSGRIDPPESERNLLRSARDIAVVASGDVYVLVNDRWVRRYR